MTVSRVHLHFPLWPCFAVAGRFCCSRAVDDNLLTNFKSTGKISTFRQQKKELTEIRKGNECGIGIDGFEAFRPGDQIQAYEEFTEKRHL